MTKIPTIQSTRPAPPSTPKTPGGISRGNTAQWRLTPLQRMGHAALARSNSINLPTKLRDAVPAESWTQQPSPVSIKPSFTGTISTQGSEDQIVPDSEDEEEEPNTELSTTPLDLKRFSFTAN
jgi:exonuclease-1